MFEFIGNSSSVEIKLHEFAINLKILEMINSILFIYLNIRLKIR